MLVFAKYRGLQATDETLTANRYRSVVYIDMFSMVGRHKPNQTSPNNQKQIVIRTKMTTL